MSDLLIIGFDDEATAHNAFAEVQRLQADMLLELGAAAVVHRAGGGALWERARRGALHKSGLVTVVEKPTLDKVQEALCQFGGTVLQTVAITRRRGEAAEALTGGKPQVSVRRGRTVPTPPGWA